MRNFDPSNLSSEFAALKADFQLFKAWLEKFNPASIEKAFAGLRTDLVQLDARLSDLEQKFAPLAKQIETEIAGTGAATAHVAGVAEAVQGEEVGKHSA